MLFARRLVHPHNLAGPRRVDRDNLRVGADTLSTNDQIVFEPEPCFYPDERLLHGVLDGWVDEIKKRLVDESAVGLPVSYPPIPFQNLPWRVLLPHKLLFRRLSQFLSYPLEPHPALRHNHCRKATVLTQQPQQ